VRRKIGKFHKQNIFRLPYNIIPAQSFHFHAVGTELREHCYINQTAPVSTGTTFLFGSMREKKLSFFVRIMQLHAVLSSSEERERYLVN
jgi:hypothetical protein